MNGKKTRVKRIVAQSLLPLLGNGSSEIRLNVSLRPDELTASNERSPGPFLTINESHPLAWIVDGSLVSGAGSIFKKVFLVVQKDNYHNIHQTHRPVVNPDIDLLWQQSFSYYQAEQPDAFIIFSSQADKDRHLLPYKPLFYCCQTQQFFHPPCPVCGNLLEQCYDDDVLSHAGLGSYNNSIKRYLYCPECFSSKENAAFYVYERHPSDSPMLRDRRDLIRGFSQLMEGDFQPETLPCLSCMQALKCYGTDTKAAKRITPFAFYNFYLLVHDAPSFHPLDFLALTAGAVPEEIIGRLKVEGEYGRLDRLKAFFPKDRKSFSFLFKNQDSWPVEVFFLKINFLAQLFSSMTPLLDSQSHPDLCLPIDQFWLKIAAYDRHLPFCWNFTIRPIGPGFNTGSADNQYLKPPSAGMLFSLAQIWFFALFFNKKNDLKDIQANLAGLLDEQCLHDFTVFEQKVTSGQLPALRPKNILWDPEATGAAESLQPFWLHTLRLGWTLFRASYGLEPDWSQEKFTLELDSLAKELRTNLVQAIASNQGLSNFREQAFSQNRENAAIGNILQLIFDKWQEGAARTAPEQVNAADETQIITTSVRPGTQEVSAISPTFNDKAAEIEATQILQRQGTEQGIPLTGKQPSSTEEIMETQILSPDQATSRRPRPHSGADAAQKQTEDIEQTVILSNRTSHSAPPEPRHTSQSPGSPVAKPENKKQAGLEKQGDNDKNFNEDISETVIISPEELAKLRRKS